MKGQKLLLPVNSLLFLAFLTTIVSIAIYRFIPSELQGDEIVGTVHGIAGQIFFYLAVCHIILNWNWIKMKLFKKKKGSK